MILRSLSCLLASVLLFNACVLQPNNLRKADPLSTGDYKTLAANEPAYDTEPNPIPSAYALAEPEDQIDILSVGADQPVSLTLDRAAPKNLSAELNGMTMLPLTMKYEFLEPDTVKEGRQKYTATIREIRDYRNYLREHKNFLMAELRRMQKEEIAEEAHKLRLALNSASDKEAKQTVREVHKTTVAVIKDDYGQYRQKLNEVHQQDQAQLKDKITEYKIARAGLSNKSGDFQTQASVEEDFWKYIRWGVTSFAGIFGIVSVFREALSDLIPQRAQELQQQSDKQVRSVPPPLINHPSNVTSPILLPPHESERLLNIPATTISQKEINPSVLTQEFTNLLAQNHQSIQQSFDALNSQSGLSFSPLFLALRARDIYDKLNQLAGDSMVLHSDDAKKYQNCGDLVKRVINREISAIRLSEENCDIANQAIVTPISADALSVFRESDNSKTSIVEFLKGKPYLLDTEENNDGTLSLVFSLTYGSKEQNQNLQTWLLKVLHTYFDKSFPDVPPAGEVVPPGETYVSPNARIIKQLISETAELKVKLKGPASCHQNPDMELSVGRVSDVTSTVNTSSLLMDGDYTYALGFFDSATQKTETLVSYTIPHLSHTLGLSARQQAQSSYLLSLSDYPLQILPTHRHLDDLLNRPVVESEPYKNRQLLSFLVKNRTGNMFNTRILRIGENSSEAQMCYDFYRGDCINSSSAAFNFDYRRVETGLYDVIAEYSTARNEEPTGEFKVQEVSTPVKPLIPAIVLGYSNITKNHPDNQPDPFKSQPTRLRVLAANGYYKSFSRYMSYPENLNAVSNVFTNSGGISPYQINLKKGYKSTYNISYDDKDFEVAQDAVLPLSSSGYPEQSFEHEFKQVFDSIGQDSELAEGNGNLSLSGKMFFNFFQDVLGRNETQSRVLDPAQESEQKHLHVGAAVSLRNGSPLFNNMLFTTFDENAENPFLDVPLRLQVIDKATLSPVAEWQFFGKLGTVTYVERYWDGHHRLVTDTEVKDIGRPSYLQGNYAIRVVPDIDQVTAYFDIMSARSDSRKSFALAPYILQPEDIQERKVGTDGLTDFFGKTSSVANIQIKSTSTAVSTGSNPRSGSDIRWDYVQKAEDIFPDFNSEFNRVRVALNQPNYQIASSVFGSGFGVAQSSGIDYESGQIPNLRTSPQYIIQPLKVDLEKERIMREKLEEIMQINLRIENLVAQVDVKRTANALASSETQALITELSADLKAMNILLRGAMTQGWINPDLVYWLSKMQVRNMYRTLGFTTVLASVASSSPNYEYVIQRLWDTLSVFGEVGSEIALSSRVENCESLSSGKVNSGSKEALREYLKKRQAYIYWEYNQLMTDLSLFLEAGKYGAESDLIPFEKRLKTLFLEAYRTKNYMTFLCSSCTAEDRRQEILKDDLTETSISQYDIFFKGTLPTRDYLMKPVKTQLASRTVTEDDLKCRVCKMNNNREREDFGVTLKLREGLRRDDNKERRIGILSDRLKTASIGFTLLTEPVPEAIYKNPLFMISFSSNDSTLVIENNRGLKSQDELRNELLQRIIQNLSTGGKPAIYRDTVLTVNNILIAQSANTLGTSPTYRHFDDINGLYYHSENKILETIKTLPQTRGFDDINLYSDRINCEKCQELSFRANRVSQYDIFSNSVLILDPIAGGVNLPFLQTNLFAETHIRRVEMRSGPLQLAEGIRQAETLALIPFIDGLLEGNTNLCTAYQ